MSFLLNSTSWILSSVFVVIPSILLSLIILWIVRKTISAHSLRQHHDVTGFTLGIVGVLYSVILGYTVVNVQGRYNEVLQTIHTEAICVADLYREAGFFPTDNERAIRSSLRSYIDYVVKKEWWQTDGKQIHIHAQRILDDIWNSYYQVDLQNEKMSVLYSDSIGKLGNFMNSRLSRQFSSWERLSPMMWSILIIGGIITVCFMFFFGLESIRIQAIMIAFLAGYVSFTLYLVYSLDNVFKGPQGIKPAALEQVVELFDEWDKQ